MLSIAVDQVELKLLQVVVHGSGHDLLMVFGRIFQISLLSCICIAVKHGLPSEIP